ncbi:acyltransferase family protein [Actinomadura rugatobispora]|uniref:Acyltransferase family protein n=1 Tax=Actinomadura rugatobispora TaxID=1994 RepID=A0ABW1AGE3_9ACTN
MPDTSPPGGPADGAAPQNGPAPAPTGAERLGWLDALRGIAAIAVALHHGCYHYLPQFRHEILRWLDPGNSGVLLFFLVSGYIIPASLERTGSARRFWISRLFRIYPLLLAVLAVTLLLAVTGLMPLRQRLGEAYDPLGAIAAHLTMMQDLLAVPSALNVLWTLSYEMIFYLLVVALFALGRLDRHSASIATALAVAALGLGVLLPTAALSRDHGITTVAVTAALVMAAAIALACSSRTRLARTGALLGGALAAVLLLGNARVEAWEGLALLAVMFAGTAIHRAERGQISVRAAAVAVTAVLAAAIGGGLWHITVYAPGQTEFVLKRAWTIGILVTALVFALGMALRRRRVPRWLTRLGLISYSVYLVHPVLLIVSDITIGRPRADAPLLLVPYLVAVLLVSHLTYRWIEAPLQRLGRRLARRTAPVLREGALPDGADAAPAAAESTAKTAPTTAAKAAAGDA